MIEMHQKTDCKTKKDPEEKKDVKKIYEKDPLSPSKEWMRETLEDLESLLNQVPMDTDEEENEELMEVEHEKAEEDE